MKKRLRIILVLIIIGAGGGFTYISLHKNDDSSSLLASGTIEIIETQLSFRVPGILDKRLVDEGDSVNKDQLIAVLDDTDQRINLNGAQANLAYATAMLAELTAGSRPQEIGQAQARVMQAKAVLLELSNGSRPQEIQRAQADLARAQAAENAAAAQLNQAKLDFQRYKTLYQSDSVSKNMYDINQTRFITAENSWKEAKEHITGAREYLSLLQDGPRIEKIHQAEAALKMVEEEYSLIKAGPRVEEINKAKARLQSADVALKQAEQQLLYTKIHAPMAGVVLSKSAEPGEYLNPAIPVVTIGDVRHPWLRCYINEKNLGKIQLGQVAKISTDSFPDQTYTGKISYISSQAEFTPKAVQTFEERVKLMFRVKIILENPANELKPGMPADAKIEFNK
jgi:HlyD family secretion protein